MTFAEELQIGAVIFGDIESFQQNAPVVFPTKTVGKEVVSGTIQKLPDGPTAQFPAITNILQALSLGLQGAMGQPVSFAEKFGGTWIGYTIQVTAAV